MEADECTSSNALGVYAQPRQRLTKTLSVLRFPRITGNHLPWQEDQAETEDRADESGDHLAKGSWSTR